MSKTLEKANIIGQEWKHWCRLCGKDAKTFDVSSEQNELITSTASTEQSNIKVTDFIEQFFRINIRNGGDLPNSLCMKCDSLVTSLLKFVDHVKQVQNMYEAIRLAGEWNPIDLRMLREKYNMVEDNIYTFKFLHHDPCTKSTIEKIFVADASNIVVHNTLNTAIKSEMSTDEVPSGLLTNDEAEDKNEFDDPIGDVNEIIYSDNESYDDSKSKLDISKHLEVDFKVEKGGGGSRLRNCKKIIGSCEEEKEKTKFSCDECSQHYQQAGKYRAHMKKKHGVIEEPLTCSQCPKTFESHNKLNRHIKTHRPMEEKKIFPCTQCDRKFQTKDYVTKHIKLVHEVEEKKIFPCPQCDKKFQTKGYVAKHIKFVHEVEEKKLFPCPQCDKKFQAKDSVTKHIKYVHDDIRPFICEECGEAVRKEATLREHMLIHSGYKPFACDICKKGFRNKYRLKSHKEIHSFNKYICTECGLKLNSRVTLRRHMLVHSDVMRHKCEYCGRAFKRANALKDHLILHSGLKPYSCDFCDKTFANNANCRSHKRKSHPEELAELEASGEKRCTNNIPKLSVLKAVTRSAENLIPVVSKHSSNFSFGKRPVSPSNDTKSAKMPKVDGSVSGANKSKLGSDSLTIMSNVKSAFW